MLIIIVINLLNLFIKRTNQFSILLSNLIIRFLIINNLIIYYFKIIFYKFICKFSRTILIFLTITISLTRSIKKYILQNIYLYYIFDY